jgi:hypothetical protein
MRALGVDFGGVIKPYAEEDPDWHVGPMPDAFATLAALRTAFDGRVYVVSKCGVQTERRTRHWLADQGFFDHTGIRPEDVRFCRTRQAKAPIAAELDLTHFVDDHMEVLSYLTTVPHRYLFASADAPGPGVRPVRSWRELREELSG